MSTVVSQTKLQTESADFEVDFLSRLAVGETVLTAASTVEVLSGVDANPTAMLSGLPSILGAVVTQRLIGGLPGVVYQLSIAVRTSTGAIPINRTAIAVLTSASVTPP